MDERNKNPNQDLDILGKETYDYLNKLEQNEHEIVSKGNHIEQLYNQLKVLHNCTRNKQIIFNKRFEELSAITSIVDPDKFPIFNTSENLSFLDLVSCWEYYPEIKQKINKNLGFTLSV